MTAHRRPVRYVPCGPPLFPSPPNVNQYDSAACIFTGDTAQHLAGSFDNDTDCNIFKATSGSSFGSLSFGAVAQAGLSYEVVANDLTVVGSLTATTKDLDATPSPLQVVIQLRPLPIG